jgi:hypothetical protein
VRYELAKLRATMNENELPRRFGPISRAANLVDIFPNPSISGCPRKQPATHLTIHLGF